jgi:23S rRNA (adenine2503-C2)-methyltransferase
MAAQDVETLLTLGSRPPMARIALQGVTPEALVGALPAISLPSARKIVSAVYRFGHVPSVLPHVRREEMAAVADRCHVPALEEVDRLASAQDPFVKIVLRSKGQVFETVRIPLERPGRFSVCVSSQVGCALACAFCATGRMGLVRNLETWEIVEQVRMVRRSLERDAIPGRVHGIVFQGMGEPLANVDRVLDAIAVLSDPSALAIDARNMTVCTSGLPAGIVRLAHEAPKVRLGLSIGSARPEVRRRLMPIDAAHGLDAVLDAAVTHARQTGLSPMWAVALLRDVNDTPDDARALAARAKEFFERTGQRPRISIIPYNSIGTDQPGDEPFEPTPIDAENRFRQVLGECGLGTHRRYSGGGDVNAACGQLAARS